VITHCLGQHVVCVDIGIVTKVQDSVVVFITLQQWLLSCCHLTCQNEHSHASRYQTSASYKVYIVYCMPSSKFMQYSHETRIEAAANFDHNCLCPELSQKCLPRMCHERRWNKFEQVVSRTECQKMAASSCTLAKVQCRYCFQHQELLHSRENCPRCKICFSVLVAAPLAPELYASLCSSLSRLTSCDVFSSYFYWSAPGVCLPLYGAWWQSHHTSLCEQFSLSTAIPLRVQYQSETASNYNIQIIHYFVFTAPCCIAMERWCRRMTSIRLSVCLSVCLSMTLMDADHIRWVRFLLAETQPCRPARNQVTLSRSVTINNLRDGTITFSFVKVQSLHAFYFFIRKARYLRHNNS